MYTGTVKCYSSSLVLARSGARKIETTTGLLLLRYVQGGLVLGPGALILEESSRPWPRLLGYNNLHERREVRTQEV